MLTTGAAPGSPRGRKSHRSGIADISPGHVDPPGLGSTTCSASGSGAGAARSGAEGVLLSIPGIQRRTAEVVIAEIGTDMTRFPTSRHLASWAGLCPGNNESAGKRKHGRTTKGSPWLRTALVEAALGATRKNGYFQAKYRRVRSRRGHQRAVIAVAHAQLEIIHTLLSRGELYTDLGSDFFERQQEERITKRAIRQLEKLGHQVILKSPEVAVPT